MQLNIRQCGILTDILCREITDVRELTARAGVSARTLNNDVLAIHDALSEFGIALRLQRGEGYQVEARAPETLAWLRGQLRARSYYTAPHEAEADGRVGEIARMLLMAGGYMTIDRIADALFLTRSALNQDFRALRQVLARYDLTLDTKPHHGVAILGEEPGYRQCLVDFCRPYHHSMEPLSFFPDGYARLNIDHAEVRRLYTLISRLFHAREISCTGQSLERLVITALVVRHRSKRKETTYPLPEELARSVQNSPAFALAQEILARPQRELPRNELGYFAMILLANVSFGRKEDLMRCGIFYEHARTLQEKVLRQFAQENLSFRADAEFEESLLHLMLQYAVRAQLRLPEWEYDGPAMQLAQQMPASRALACMTLRLLDGESGYFGGQYMLIALTQLYYNAIMCIPTKREKLRILCVAPHERNTARSMAYKIQRQHSSYVERVDACLPWELFACDVQQYDCIVTSEPLEFISTAQTIPIIELKYFMSWRDLYDFRNRIILPSVTSQGLLSAQPQTPPPEQPLPESDADFAELAQVLLGESDAAVLAHERKCAAALPLHSEQGVALLVRLVRGEERTVIYQHTPPLRWGAQEIHTTVCCALSHEGQTQILKSADSVLRRVLHGEDRTGIE